jgi:hypothetical protein
MPPDTLDPGFKVLSTNPGGTASPAPSKPAKPATPAGPDFKVLSTGSSVPPKGDGPDFKVLSTGAPVNPMDTSSGTSEPALPVSGASLPQMAHSTLNQIGGQADLPFIIANAQNRDGVKSLADLRRVMADPNSFTAKAWALYKKDPAQAMDEYGFGSPAQNAFMAKNFPDTFEGKYGSFMGQHPATNSLVTFLGEMANPMAAAEGGAVGKALSLANKGGKLDRAAQAVAKPIGLGSPFRGNPLAADEMARTGIEDRAGTEGGYWLRGGIASIKHEDSMSASMRAQIFDGLTQQQKWEVVRLSQGLRPDPQFFRQYNDLARRAQALRPDIKHVTAEQVRVGRLKPEEAQVHNPETYFPMSNSYDFGPQWELEQELRGAPPGGSGSTANRPKTLANYDLAKASGHLAADADAAVNYETWRRQRMQGVAFEDALARAPESLRRDIRPSDYVNAAGQPLRQGDTPNTFTWTADNGLQSGSRPWKRTPNQTPHEAMEQTVAENNAHYPPGHPQRLTLADQKQYVAAKNVLQNMRSPILQKSMVAPELWKFFQKDSQFQKYVDQGGSMLPGEENTWSGKLIGVFRSTMLANPAFHPAVNIAGNDAAARSLHGLGGPIWEAGGYAYNAAKAVALQLGMKKPEDFIGGAQEYANWFDRALKAGATAEFGTARTSMAGGEHARVVSTAIEGKGVNTWLPRLDKAMTRFNDWNQKRTFGDKGEATFAVSLFKDAVEKGNLSDYEAARVVREALGDYYNFDPKSKMSAGLLFMPWLKSNAKFWTNVLARKPQFVAGPQHAIRNYNQQTGDPGMQSPYAVPDWRIHMGEDEHGSPNYMTPPFVGRVISDVTQTIGAKSPEEGLYNLDRTLEGRANPLARVGLDALYTTWKGMSGKEMVGPETDYHAIFNPKAPAKEQMVQIGKYMVAHGVPVPLFGFALQDAMRRGFDPHDLTTSLLTASGVGYGSQGMTDDQRRQVSAAQKQYLKIYYAYQDNHDDQMLNDAWEWYTSRLKDAGVIR